MEGIDRFAVDGLEQKRVYNEFITDRDMLPTSPRVAPPSYAAQGPRGAPRSSPHSPRLRGLLFRCRGEWCSSLIELKQCIYSIGHTDAYLPQGLGVCCFVVVNCGWGLSSFVGCFLAAVGGAPRPRSRSLACDWVLCWGVLPLGRLRCSC